MSTNFYWHIPTLPRGVVTLPTGAEYELPGIDRMDPAVHLGKRSAAGLYCWDCDETLCAGGRSAIHMGRAEWFSACPKCGTKHAPAPSGLTRSGPAAVELGWAKPEAERPRGVAGTASFNWAQDPAVVRRVCEERATEALVVDEYGDTLTGGEFLRMVRCNCAIEFTDLIGEAFS